MLFAAPPVSGNNFVLVTWSSISKTLHLYAMEIVNTHNIFRFVESAYFNDIKNITTLEGRYEYYSQVRMQYSCDDVIGYANIYGI